MTNDFTEIFSTNGQLRLCEISSDKIILEICDTYSSYTKDYFFFLLLFQLGIIFIGIINLINFKNKNEKIMLLDLANIPFLAIVIRIFFIAFIDMLKFSDSFHRNILLIFFIITLIITILNLIRLTKRFFKWIQKNKIIKKE